ncbi:unnamed protein product [Spirodela intermedia]|uniref:Uncharacterized protein n=1 Tax=Spirodela intermedia TaxID=51605 RepID=A0A7I8IAS6_SPIIN|nr:unnamed protein product [Spirodela intermedia]CAA6654504.1 unnamed protein product [Spirodela intermedia]
MSHNCIRLEEEIEGDREGTSDFAFFRIGSSVPLKRGDSSFDLSKPPGRPLAVSEKFGVLFLVSDGGFIAVKTVDVIGIAKRIKEIEEENRNKEDAENLCVQEKSILDAQIGAVHILAVSTDSSILAATVGRKQETCFVCSVGESSNIKDFLWRKNRETSFIMLSSCGLLYHGNMKDNLKNIMDGVEAVDWSVDGNLLAVARKNVLSILSSEYKEKLSMSLFIVIGCFQVNEDDEEIDYTVQVVTTTDPGFGEASSKAVVVSFSDLFHGIVDDIVPSGSGPHLFVNYLKTVKYFSLCTLCSQLNIFLPFYVARDLALVANRKNTDEHVVLLAWSGEDGKGPIGLEFEQEKFIPRIELQESRDENLLLGFDIDRVSIHEKLELIIDSEVKVLSPHCVLLCLSCEGKIIMFHVARLLLSALAGQASGTFGSVRSSTVLGQANISPARNEKTEQIARFSAESSLKQGINSTGMKSGTYVSLLGSQRSEASSTMESSTVFSKNKGGPTSVIPDNLPITPLGVESVGKSSVSDGTMLKSSLYSYESTLGDSQGAVGSQRKTISQGFSSVIQPSVKLPQESGGFTSFLDSTRAPLRSGYIEPVPALGIPSTSSKENITHGKFLISNTQDAGGGHKAYRFPGMQESETKLIKQFYSVDDMTKELDELLAGIEQEGGLRDACTVIQRSSVLSLEEGVNKLSEKLRMCKIQQLQDKRMQVSARQIYMEGLVKQASNGQYWDLWNCQKLGPEYEVKQQRISKLNHALVNELVELERHFNALELRKHGESGTSINGRRALRDTLGSPSLHNTLNSQIAAAEQLSDCLSKQMGLLKISSPPAKQHSVRKELLESIGLEYDSDSFQSPTQKKAVYSPESSKRISFLPLSSRAGEKVRTTVGALKAVEPESSRRRRDSLDRPILISFCGNTLKINVVQFVIENILQLCPSSWSRFDPPKTTVKRMQLEERFKVATEKLRSSVKEESGLQVSEGTFSLHQGQVTPDPSLQLSMNRFQSRVDNIKKDDQNKSSWQLSEPQSSSHFKWTKDLSQVSQTGGTRYPVASDVQTGLQSTPVALPSSLSKGLVDKFGKEMSQTTKQPVSSKVEIESQTREKVRAEIGMPAPTSIPHRMHHQLKHPNQNGAMSSGPSPKIMGRSVIPDSSFRLSEKSRLSLSSNMSGNVSQVKTVGTPSSTPFSGTISTSSSVVLPVPSPTPLPSPLVPVSTSASASPAVFGGSSSATAFSLGPSQTSSSSISSVAPVEPLRSSSNLSSPPQISKITGPASILPKDVTSQLPQAQLCSTVSSEVSTALKADRISMFTPAASLSSTTSPLSEIPATSSSSQTIPTKGKDAADITTTEDDEMEEEAPDTLLSWVHLVGLHLGKLLYQVRLNPIHLVSHSTPVQQPPQLQRFPWQHLPVSSSDQHHSSANDFWRIFRRWFERVWPPAQIGAGQQALGSVLGAFGQSRQLGLSAQGAGLAPSGGFGGTGFSTAAMSGGGGFAAAATPGGGFAAAATPGGGFAAAATPGGGFAAAATPGGGFAAAATTGGGFSAVAPSAGGFAAAASASGGFGVPPGSGFASGGFGSFAPKQSAGGGFSSFGGALATGGSGGFSSFGGASAAGGEKPPASLLMQMRK